MLIFLFSYFSIECRLLIFGLFSHIVIHVLVVLSWVMVFWLQIVAEHLSNWCINVYGLIIMPWIQAWHAILLVNTECIYQHCWFGLLYLASLCVQQPGNNQIMVRALVMLRWRTNYHKVSYHCPIDPFYLRHQEQRILHPSLFLFKLYCYCNDCFALCRGNGHGNIAS